MASTSLWLALKGNSRLGGWQRLSVLLILGQLGSQAPFAFQGNPATGSEAPQKIEADPPTAPHAESLDPQPTDPADPPSSRAQRWSQRRQQKSQEKKEVKQSTFQKLLLQVEKRGYQSLLSYRDFYGKILGTITTGSSFAPGIRYWKPNISGSMLTVQASATYSIRHYQEYVLQLGKDPTRRDEFVFRPNVRGKEMLRLDEPHRKVGDFFLYADLRYRDFPEEDFFGLGPHSKLADRTDFSLTSSSYGAVGGYQFTSWLNLAGRAAYLTMSNGPGEDRKFPDIRERFDDLTAPGLNRQPDFLNLSSAALVDFRDRPGNPHSGGMFGISLSRFDDRGSEEFDFSRLAIDGRYYATLGSDQRVMAFRFFTLFDDEDPGTRTPFYVQETLGGDGSLRGFRDFRFRDNNLLFLSAEYRWEASPAFELAFFYDRGKVFSKRSDFDFSGLEKGFGFGIRLKTPDSVLLRLDFARSREHSLRMHFKFGRSF